MIMALLEIPCRPSSAGLLNGPFNVKQGGFSLIERSAGDEQSMRSRLQWHPLMIVNRT